VVPITVSMRARIEGRASVNSCDCSCGASSTMCLVLPPESRAMSEYLEVETLLSARRVDVDDHTQLAAHCLEHAVAEDKLRAMIDVLRPLSESFAVYLTK